MATLPLKQPKKHHLHNGYNTMKDVLYSMKIDSIKNLEDGNPSPELEAFAFLRRQVTKGNALRGKGGIILHNGTYSVSKFVHNIDPVCKVLPINWIPKADGDEVGHLRIEDKSWDGSVPIMHATRSNVRFYGCSLDPEEDEPKIKCRDGGMFDFNYTEHYSDWIKKRRSDGNGGCRLERHKFAHIETPLDREGHSGVFVVGKEIDDGKSLCLTAFIIARGQTLYVPPNTIHTNDYQRGTWRTYLEVDDIDICDIVKKPNNPTVPWTAMDEYQPIGLRFYCGLTKKRMKQYEIPIFDLKESSETPGTPAKGHGYSFSIGKLTQDDEKTENDANEAALNFTENRAPKVYQDLSVQIFGDFQEEDEYQDEDEDDGTVKKKTPNLFWKFISDRFTNMCV